MVRNIPSSIFLACFSFIAAAFSTSWLSPCNLSSMAQNFIVRRADGIKFCEKLLVQKR
jgi:hypothetical protein